MALLEANNDWVLYFKLPLLSFLIYTQNIFLLQKQASWPAQCVMGRWERERMRMRRCPLFFFSPPRAPCQMPTVWLCQARGTGWELRPGLPCGWQGPKDLRCHLGIGWSQDLHPGTSVWGASIWGSGVPSCSVTVIPATPSSTVIYYKPTLDAFFPWNYINFIC